MSYTVWGILKYIGSFFPEIAGAPIFHAANILIHTCNGLLIFMLLRQVVRSSWAAAIGSLLFLVHPIQVEAVAWISEMRGLAAASFMFLSLYVYLLCCKLKHKNINGNRVNTYYFLCFLLFIISLLFKPSTIVMPLLALSLEYFFYNRIRSSVFHLGGMIIPVLLIAWVTNSAQEQTIGNPIWQKPFLFLFSITFYMYKIIIPFSLSPSYAMRPEYLIGQWWFYSSSIIPLGMGTLLWFKRKKWHRVFLLSSVVFVIGILPVSGLKDFIFQEWSTVADRYTYLSMFGISILFAFIFEQYRSLWKRGIMVSIITFFFVWSYFIQIPVWKDEITLWSSCIKNSPGEFKAFNSRGCAFMSKGEYKRALQDFNKSVSLKPHQVEAHNNRGILYEKLGDYSNAVLSATKAIELNPEIFNSYVIRGKAYLNLKQYQNAVADFSASIKYEPNYDSSYYYRAKAYLEMGLLKKALIDVDFLLALTPSHEKAYLLRGYIHHRMGKFSDSVNDFDRVIAINSKNVVAYVNKGIVLIDNRRFEDALKIFNQAEAVSGRVYEVFFNRGNTFQHMEDYDNAVINYNEAEKLIPDNPILFNNRAAAFYKLKQYDKAIEDIEKVKSLGGTPNPLLIKHLQHFSK